MSEDERKDLAGALAFVNYIRHVEGLPTLAEMPEGIGSKGSESSAGQALNAPVIRHGNNGQLYAILYGDDRVETFVAAGARVDTTRTTRSVNSDSNSKLIYELHLPRCLYRYGAPLKTWQW